MNGSKNVLRLACCSVLGGVVALGARGLQDPRSPASPPQDPSQIGFPDLVGSLNATPGCLGVETAITQSGKHVIFAWFKDKKATVRWYYSDMHSGVAKQFFPGSGTEDFEPLAGVADDAGPIMAIASVTLSDKPHFEETSLPISQIAIELYAPLPGGIALGGRFAPDAVNVKDLKEGVLGKPSSARPGQSGD